MPNKPDEWLYDQWVNGGSLGLHTIASYNANLRNLIHADKVYPRQRVLSKFKRNGFKGDFHQIFPVYFFQGIVQDPGKETLLKAGQFALLRYVFQHSWGKGTLAHKNVWNSVNICIRNQYVVKDASMWMDYLDFLRELNKDLMNSYYVCPIDLKASHDLLLQRKNREQEEKRQREIAFNQELYVKEKGKFFGLVFTNGELIIKVLQSLDEFKTEGDVLKHCVFQNKYYAKSEKLVLSARIEDTPVETIEVNLRTLKVIQARGLDNLPSAYHDQVVSLINQNLPKIGKVLQLSEGGAQ